MVAVHVGKLHTAKELLLGEVLGNVSQVQSSLTVVALIQVIFVLEDFLGREGQSNLTSPACKAWFSPRHYTIRPSPWPHSSPVSARWPQPQRATGSQEDYLAAGSPGSRITE